MAKVKVINKPTSRRDTLRTTRIDSLKKKLSTKIYIGDKSQAIQQERDSLELEIKKLKIQVNKK